jgi:hypothetical protein
MMFTCKKELRKGIFCLAEFYIPQGARTAYCPKCNTKYGSTYFPKGLVRVKGQILRSTEKPKMKKKERLSLRKLKNVKAV